MGIPAVDWCPALAACCGSWWRSSKDASPADSWSCRSSPAKTGDPNPNDFSFERNLAGTWSGGNVRSCRHLEELVTPVSAGLSAKPERNDHKGVEVRRGEQHLRNTGSKDMLEVSAKVGYHWLLLL